MAIILYPNTDWDGFVDETTVTTILTSLVPDLTDWNALTVEVREVYIRQATLLISQEITIPDALEKDLQKATAYLANYSIGKDMQEENGSELLKRKRIEGVVDKEWFAPRETKSNELPDIVERLIAQYKLSGSSSFTFTRA